MSSRLDPCRSPLERGSPEFRSDGRTTWGTTIHAPAGRVEHRFSFETRRPAVANSREALEFNADGRAVRGPGSSQLERMLDR